MNNPLPSLLNSIIFSTKLIILFAICSLSNSKVNAVSASFESLTVRDGLPASSVRKIVQDKQGYIWIGTEFGLVRYDGVQVKRYLANEELDGTIAGPYVRALEVDNENTLWVGGSRFGLSRYNRHSNDFTTLTHDPKNENSLSANTVTTIKSDKNSTLWISTIQGIDRYDTRAKKFFHYSYFFDLKLSEKVPAKNGDLRVIEITDDGTVWSGGNKGLSKFNSKQDRFEIVELKNGPQPTVLSIAEKNKDELWVGTREGLYILSRAQKQVRKFEFKSKVRWIHALLVDSEYVWVGTSRFGVYRIDNNGKTINIAPDKSNKYALGDIVAFDFLKDHSGMLWIATYNAGAYFFDPNSLEFGAHDNSINSISCLKSSDVRSVYAIDDDNFLFGTVSGLFKVNLEANLCENYVYDEDDSSSLSGNEIYSIYKINNDEVWVGTNRGLNKLNMKTRSIKRYVQPNSERRKLSIHEILPYGDKFVLATHYGAYLFSPDTDTIEKIIYKDSPVEERWIHNLKYDKQGKIWAGAFYGFFRVDVENRQLRPIVPKGHDKMSEYIWGLDIDENNIIWLAIEDKGLFKYYIDENRMEPFGKSIGFDIKNGFAGVHLLEGKLWIATYGSGLFIIETKTNEIIHYDAKNGLQPGFTLGSFTRLPNNQLFFGGKTGFNIFSPEQIKENKNPPLISLSQFKLFGKVATPPNSNRTASLHISEVSNIELSYRDKVFGFDFVAMDYFAPKAISYSYMLEGFDREWNKSSAQNRGVTYNNVSPGEYTFRVKAKNSRGVWSENDVALKVSIAPAPWLTWWAYTIYLILFVFSIWLTINKRTQWLKKRAEELESTVHIRTSELASEKEKVEQLLSKKNEEFANVSHEFRTPLTLILGPIKQLKAWTKEDRYKQKLNVVQRNSLRLLRMVDQLLNLETFRVKAITQKSPQAIGKITRLVAEAFADLAEEKQITFNIEIIEPVCFDFTPDAFEKIILNLLSNTIKYTKPGGTITVCTTRIEQAQYQIQVSDTGIGIAKDKLDKVFERFNRVMDENSEQVTGSGIGLALVKSLVESHDGSVELESELGQGTTITVTLPIVNEVDESQINVHQNDEIIAMELMNVSSSGLHESSITQSTETIQSTGKPTVLVIEDNDDMRQYIVESIGQQFNTLVAADGQAGLELAIQEVPDLIISDIMMPKLDGYQTTKALREAQITNHIPVVLLTARGDRDSRLKGWEEKADEYITKPFDVEELIIRISNLIEIRNILKRRFSETVFEQTEQAPESLVQEMDGDSESLSIVEINTQKLQQEFIKQLNQRIELVYREVNITILELAKSVNMSERQFSRKLKSIVDMTPSEYLRRFRLEKAKDILLRGKPVGYTALEVGFSSQSYFNKCFKAQYGMTPKQFMNQKTG